MVMVFLDFANETKVALNDALTVFFLKSPLCVKGCNLMPENNFY